MSMDKSDVIDYLSINDSGQILLTITDDLDWSNESEHLDALQKKINAYLAAVESGEVFEMASKAAGKEVPCTAPLLIEIVVPFPWPPPAQDFLSYAKQAVADAGIELTFRVFPPSAQSPS